MSYVLRKSSEPCRGWLREHGTQTTYTRDRAKAWRFDTREEADAQSQDGDKVELLTLSRWNHPIEPSQAGFYPAARRY